MQEKLQSGPRLIQLSTAFFERSATRDRDPRQGMWWVEKGRLA
jgi:hypothetical protein